MVNENHTKYEKHYATVLYKSTVQIYINNQQLYATSYYISN